MIELMKYLLKGLWTVVKLPVILVCYLFVLLFGLLEYIFFGIKGIILFFRGQSLQNIDEKSNKLDECRKKLIEKLNPFNHIEDEKKEENSNE